MMRVRSLVDYAHTPDALVQVLSTLKRHVEQQLWAVLAVVETVTVANARLMTQAALNGADVALLQITHGNENP